MDAQWVVRRDPAPSEELLGAADIQSLADVGNSYGLVRDMRTIPFAEGLIMRVIQVVF